jgi:MFS family permease
MNKHLRHNYIVNVLDGSFFWLGYSFIAPGVILPLYVSHFTQNKLIIGLVAVIGSTGYFFPQLFTSNWVEQIAVKKVLPVNLGFFTERVPILILPLTVLLVTPLPGLALSLLLFFFAWHSFGAGVVAVAWNAMIAKVIPVEMRGVFMGLTTFIGTGTGILGAMFAAYLLERFAFPLGYLICFTIAGVAVLISWVFLAWTREEPDQDIKPKTSQREYWRLLPGVLRSDKNFRWYLFAQLFIGLGGMSWGFMAVYALETWNLSDGKVGTFTTAMLIGQAAANLIFGLMADRYGYKLILVFSIFVSFLAVVLSLVISSPELFYIVFALRGMSFAGFFLAGMIVYEFSKADIRPTYIGLNNTWLGLMTFVAPIIGGILAQYFGYPVLFFTAAVLSFLGGIVIVFFVRDPRRILVSKPSPSTLPS